MFDGQHRKMFKSAKEEEIINYLCEHDSDLLMFHHRYPTSTINVAQAAHPLRTRNYFGNTEYIMVHNGIIRNPNALFPRHSDIGIEYQTLLQDLTFNDSESLLWDLALTLEGKQKEMRAYGDMAFIMIKLVNGKLKKMYAGRNLRPLKMYKSHESIAISSEGEGVMLPPDMLTMFDYNTRKFTMNKMEFRQYKKGEYKSGVTYKSTGVRNSGFTNSTSTYGSGYKPTEYFPPKKEEYRTYDEFIVEKRKAKAEKNWLRLRAKFSKHLSPATTAPTLASEKHEGHVISQINDVLETMRDKDGTFIVASKRDTSPRVDMDLIVENKRLYEPSSGEIQNMAMDYMIDSQGNFEDAYGKLEADYSDYMSECQGCETMNDMRQMLLMEAAMVFINSDPEYENEKSTSSIWEALWNQQRLSLQT